MKVLLVDACGHVAEQEVSSPIPVVSVMPPVRLPAWGPSLENTTIFLPPPARFSLAWAEVGIYREDPRDRRLCPFPAAPMLWMPIDARPTEEDYGCRLRLEVTLEHSQSHARRTEAFTVAIGLARAFDAITYAKDTMAKFVDALNPAGAPSMAPYLAKAWRAVLASRTSRPIRFVPSGPITPEQTAAALDHGGADTMTPPSGVPEIRWSEYNRRMNELFRREAG